MSSNENLFLDAFAGKPREEAKEVNQGGQYLSNNEREELFRDGFGREETKAPRPHLGQNWRLNVQKTRGLSFTELFQLHDLQDVPYRRLPSWVIDGGYAEPTAAEKKYQKQQFQETGLTQSERNEVFNQFAADISYLADMTTREILRDSAVLEGEMSRLFARYSKDEVLDALRENHPKAAEYFTAKSNALEAEARAAAIAEAEQAKAQSVADEIRAAQEAIAAMDSKAASDLEQIPADLLQQELTRRAALKTREEADQD